MSSCQNLKQKLILSESSINTIANHLIVIFVLSMPLLISVRRLSLVFILLLFLLRGRFAYYIGEAVKDPVVCAFTAYFFVHVLWLFGTNDYSNGKSTVHDAAFLLIPLIFSSFIDRKFIPRIYGAFFVGMFASELVSYGIFFEIIKPMVHYGNQGTPSDPTPVYHHTHYGFMLATSLVLIVQHLIVGKNNKFVQIMLSIFFVSASINIFMIGGRSGYVLYGIYLLALIFLIYKKRFVRPMLIMMIVVTTTLVLAYQMSPTFKERVDLTTESVSDVMVEGYYANSLGGRIGILDYSSDLIVDNWMIGLGTGDQTQEVLGEIRRKDKDLSSFFNELGHLHNEYLSALLQFGIAGLLVFINIPFQLLRYRNQDDEIKVMFRLLGIGIMLFTLVDILVLGLGMLFTVVILVSVGLRKYVTNNAVVESFTVLQGMYYMIAILIFYLIKMVLQ